MRNEITVGGRMFRVPAYLLAICGLIAVAVLALPRDATAAEPSWERSEMVPAQVYPGSTFLYRLRLVRTGSAFSFEELNVRIVAPAGFQFDEHLKHSCTIEEEASTLSCVVPAGIRGGKYNLMESMVRVDPNASLGSRNFRLEFSGGPAAAPPPTVLSRPTEVAASGKSFGIAEVDTVELNEDGSVATQAGGHPWATSSTIRFNTMPVPGKVHVQGGLEDITAVVPSDSVKDIIFDLPTGYLGNPEATPKCTPDQLSTFTQFPWGIADCPIASQVGVVDLEGAETFFHLPVFNIKPPGGVPAEFGFNALGTVVTFFPEVRPNDNGIRVRFHNISQTIKLFGSTLTLWGSPSDHSHDYARGLCGGNDGVPYSGEKCPEASLLPPKGFYVAPTSCLAPLTTNVAVKGWLGAEDTAQFTTHDANGQSQGLTGCDRVPFDPQMTAQQTAKVADAPSGLDFELSVPEAGILNPTGVSQAHLRKAVVKLPEGVTLNPSAAEGLSGCDQVQYEAETLKSEFGSGCPAAAKVGDVEITSPVLPEGEVLKGSVFIAKPFDNQFHSLVAMYLVARNVDRGIIIKSAGKVDLDPRTGQVVTTFDDLPQLPFAELHLNLREGPRAPLTTPSSCGTYTVEAELTPWSAKANPAPSEIAHVQSSYRITQGPGGGACPAGNAAPFHPRFEAGSINNNAGSYSPFYIRLTRSDGEQELTRFSAILPPGVTGKLAGVSECPEGAIAAARLKSGVGELAQPSCPAKSQIGRIVAGAGVGSALTYVPGRVYLGGPYKGDPLSVVVITPAVAGPFDIGNVVTREPLAVNPKTVEVEADGAGADPIPHILSGVPVRLRDLRVYVDRDRFILNPTGCNPSNAKGTLFGSNQNPFDAADDAVANLLARYQAADCAALGFKPSLTLSLKGKTKRSGHPALKAVLTYPKEGNYANIASAQVGLPHSEFLDQGNIGTVCTQAQLKSKTCPKKSIYGKAKAWTPLLDKPLEGPVYLGVGYGHKLPDLVADLDGQIRVLLNGKVDTTKHEGLRNTFSMVPDAPVSRFVLELKGGKKYGLLENSENLCRKKNHAEAKFVAQNGAVLKLKPQLKIKCPKKRPGGGKQGKH